jgi:hypothetical protein
MSQRQSERQPREKEVSSVHAMKGKVTVYFVRRANSGRVIQLLCIESESERSLDARTKSLCVAYNVVEFI